MPTYIGLLKLTDQGIRNLKGIVAQQQRGEGRAVVERLGGRIIGAWWTQGAYDASLVQDRPDDETASACMLTLATTQGNVRSETMHAYTVEEMQWIVQKTALSQRSSVTALFVLDRLLSASSLEPAPGWAGEDSALAR